MKLIKVGYVLTDRKAKNLGFLKASLDQRYEGKFQIVKIDPFKPLNEQGGPFDVVVHKLIETLIENKTLLEDIKKREAAIDNFLENIKLDNTLLIDPYSGHYILTSRHETINITLQSVKIINDSKIKATKQIILNDSTSSRNLIDILNNNNIDFPVIIKPNDAQASLDRYNMTIYANKSQLPQSLTPMILIQQYVNHDGVLYKIYTIGHAWYVVRRPSFKNIQPNTLKDPICFRSDEFNKIKNTSENTLKEHILFQDEIMGNNIFLSSGENNTHPYYNIFKKIIEAIQKQLNCYLLGIDVIISSDEEDFYIIDINYMPSYKYMDNFMPNLLSYISELLQNK